LETGLTDDIHVSTKIYVNGKNLILHKSLGRQVYYIKNGDYHLNAAYVNIV